MDFRLQYTRIIWFNDFLFHPTSMNEIWQVSVLSFSVSPIQLQVEKITLVQPPRAKCSTHNLHHNMIRKKDKLSYRATITTPSGNVFSSSNIAQPSSFPINCISVSYLHLTRSSLKHSRAMLSRREKEQILTQILGSVKARGSKAFSYLVHPSK